MNDPQQVETYKGYPILWSWGGYSCPALKLYGYVNDLAIKRAITREIKKRTK